MDREQNKLATGGVGRLLLRQGLRETSRLGSEVKAEEFGLDWARLPIHCYMWYSCSRVVEVPLDISKLFRAMDGQWMPRRKIGVGADSRPSWGTRGRLVGHHALGVSEGRAVGSVVGCRNPAALTADCDVRMPTVRPWAARPLTSALCADEGCGKSINRRDL